MDEQAKATCHEWERAADGTEQAMVPAVPDNPEQEAAEQAAWQKLCDEAAAVVVRGEWKLGDDDPGDMRDMARYLDWILWGMKLADDLTVTLSQRDIAMMRDCAEASERREFSAVAPEAVRAAALEQGPHDEATVDEAVRVVLAKHGVCDPQSLEEIGERLFGPWSDAAVNDARYRALEARLSKQAVGRLSHSCGYGGTGQTNLGLLADALRATVTGGEATP